MSYDEKLAARIRKSMAGRGRVREMYAFGGVMWMLDDKMCVGVSKDRMMVRVDPAKHDALVRRPGAGRMDFTGRPMRGFLFIKPAGVRDARSLKFWVDESVSYVRTVPAKKGQRKRDTRQEAGTAAAKSARAPARRRR